MSFRSIEFFEIAKEWVKEAKRSPKAEALLRSAISRAYYALFIMARHYLRDKQKDLNIPNWGDAHRYVQERFANSSNPVFQDIGDALEQLRRERNKADYADSYPDLANTATLMLIVAENAITALSKL